MNNNSITLSEYNNRVVDFWKKLKSILTDAKDDEVYSVLNTFRNDFMERYVEHGYSHLFKTYSKIHDMIYRAEDNIDGATEDEEEYLGEFMYWTISKYKQKADGYIHLFSVYQTYIDGFLEVYFDDDFPLYANNEEMDIYNEWQKLSRIPGKRVDIIFPYKKGEIITFDGKPATTDIAYYVYLDNGKAVKKDSFGMLCIVDIQWLSDIRGFKQFAPSYFEVIDTCPDADLAFISNVIKSDDYECIVSEIEKSMNLDFDERIEFNNEFAERYNEKI